MQYKKEEIKEKIIESAAAEFELNGYQGALIKNIAEASGVPVGNIYRYFSSKSRLFDAVVEYVYNNTPDEVLKIYKKETNEDYKVKDIAGGIAESIMDIYNRFSRQLIILVYKSEGTKYSDYTEGLYKIVSKLINKELFNSDDKNDTVIAEIISKGFLDGLFEIMRTKDKNNIKRLTERLIRFYFYKIEDRI